MNNKIYNIKFIHTLSKMRKYSLVLIYIKFSNSQIFDKCKQNNLQKIKSNIEFIYFLNDNISKYGFYIIY